MAAGPIAPVGVEAGPIDTHIGMAVGTSKPVELAAGPMEDVELAARPFDPMRIKPVEVEAALIEPMEAKQREAARRYVGTIEAQGRNGAVAERAHAARVKTMMMRYGRQPRKRQVIYYGTSMM